ncbi:alpha-1,2-mannosidase, putative [Actinacidiphila alni]|uniref:Alpha-1,2-mannosidase, putative n=1 Tax=Actinacidiphila alni TaxID=380248 RepID=A0A1I1XL59_9ACTN|nr:GH92 family glycosyl hydrolase [Actinacidiphila alni]SFE06130.1 alpha-1,2-mannosidase, putative [Actinacidiphila alni]
MNRRRVARATVAAGLGAVLAMVAAGPSSALTTLSTATSSSTGLVADPAAYVDPLIGTGRGGSTVGEINNFPGPATPFGMMQFSPDTSNSYAGYQYHDDQIRGFSVDHASVGCRAFGDVPILPITGAVGDHPWDLTEHFTHTGETADPGYYAVTLDASGVQAELTAATRTGLASFTFPANAASAQLLVKSGGSLNGDKDADVRIVGDREVTGSVTTGNFCDKGNEYTVHYAIEFDQPFTAHGTWDGSTVNEDSSSADGAHAGAYLTFGDGGARTVRAKVSMSYVSVAGALANMAAEVPGWDLEALREQTRAEWTAALRKVRVAGKDTDELKTFYTALYHSLMHPNTFNDADGRYIGFDGKVRTLPKGHAQYTNFSDWDTYRSLAPLQAMLFPRQASDMAQSLVNDAVQGGWWPRWPLANSTTGQMTGDNSVPLIANLYAYGARDFDLKTALKYLVKGATSVDTTPGAYQERPGVADYVERGYAPNNDASLADHGHTGASETLEWAIDDFAISQLARAAGQKSIAAEFARRGQNWQNILDPASGYLEPRGEDGRFPDKTGFQAPADGSFGQDGYDEGNAAQYNWLVPQNVAGLITSMGGESAAADRLDAFFGELNAGPNVPYMWAGNEINFGVPWVYNHVGQPWKTQRTVRSIATSLFSPTPDGEPGNDDLGAQSSWYVWAALGVYPATPGTADLAVHSPLFTRAVIDLPGNGQDLDIRAPKASAGTPYVHRLALNGSSWKHSYLPASVTATGGVLDFSLSDTPDTHWAASSKDAAPSYRTGEKNILATATPNQSTVAPGGDGAQLTVHVQRLAGAHSASVTAKAPAGLTVTPSGGRVRLDRATGAGTVALTVRAASSTPGGYYDIPLTVKAGVGGGSTVTTTATVLVAAENSLQAGYDNVGVSPDSDRASADFDGGGSSYSREALAAAGLDSGATMKASGTSFTWPDAPSGRPDNVAAHGQRIDLGDGAADASRLLFVGSATNGDQQGTAQVTFTDGTTATADLSFGDWTLPGKGTDPVLGNSLVAKTDHRNERDKTGVAAYVFATTPFTVPTGKHLKSVTLPDNTSLHVFAIGLG